MNNKKTLRKACRFVLVFATVITTCAFMLPISNSTSPADTPIEQMAPVIGITTGAEEYENNYINTLERVNSAASLGVKHELEDFAGITRTEIVVDDKDITFSYQFFNDKTKLPFGLYTPSSSEQVTSGIPLIVWLHGSGEVNVPEKTLHMRGLHKVLDNWTLYGFNAYVVTPQLAGPNSRGNWHNKTSVEQVKEIIDYMSETYHIDTSKVYLCGHSLGGMGTTYIASKMPESFAAIMPLSGYDCGADLKSLTMPIRGYVGSVGDGSSYSYMLKLFNNKNGFGMDNLYTVPVGHGEVPNAAFNLDKDENGRSDLIEWLLSH